MLYRVHRATEKIIDLQVTDTPYHNMLYRVHRATGEYKTEDLGPKNP